MNKYKLLVNKSINVAGKKLYRIEALKDFGRVKKGNLGGYIQSESNLSQNGNAWVFDDAKVYDNAWVFDDAKVFDNAKVCGKAKVFDNARVFDAAVVCGNAKVYGSARVTDNAKVSDDARVAVFYDWSDYNDMATQWNVNASKRLITMNAL